MSTLTKEQAFDLIIQICHAMKYIHTDKNLIHRDLKPENMLILGGKIKICDFGIAKLKVNDKTTLSRIIGSPSYMAPELLNEEDKVDNKIDIWAIGVIMHQMFSRGVHPFGEIKTKITANARKGKFLLSDEVKKEPILAEIIQSCFELNPDDRLNIEQILSKLNELASPPPSHLVQKAQKHHSSTHPFGQIRLVNSSPRKPAMEGAKMRKKERLHSVNK